MKSTIANPLCSNRLRCRGFHLLEVLVTVVLFSISALSLGALQIKSKQIAYESVQRTLASELSLDLFERMRMNINGITTSPLGNYLSSSGTTTSSSIVTNTFSEVASPVRRPTAPSTSADCSLSTVTCTRVQLAQYDLYQWYERLRGSTDQRAGSLTGGLVEPTVCLSGPGSGVSGVYTITIAWRGMAEQDDSSSITCGQNNYEADFRRLLTVSTFITQR